VKKLAPLMPVIGITGEVSASTDRYIRAMKLFGAVAVLLKPLDGDTLLSVLSEAMARRTGALRGNRGTPCS